jgi:predicted transcriptional regulator
VVRYVAEGLSNREIAQRLGLTEHTVKNYLFRIFDKLGVSKRVEVVLYAYSLGSAGEIAEPTNGNGKKPATVVANKAAGTSQTLPQFSSPAMARLAKA